MKEYQEIKTELIEIAKIVEKYPESLKNSVYDLLIENYLGEHTKPSGKNPVKTNHVATTVSQESNKTKPRRTGSSESYEIDRELNLRGDKSIPSFKTFFAEKQPKGAQEFNTVAVYYLQKTIGLENISLNHVYTCYNEASKKPPVAFKQSFTDTKNKKGWVEFTTTGSLHMPHRGVMFVEHDLPHKKSEGDTGK